MISERTEFASIARHTIVSVMPKQHGTQPLSHFGDGEMHASAELPFELSQFGLHLLPHRLPKHGELSFSRLPANVRKTKKVKAVGLAFTTRLDVFGSKATEFNETCFVGM